MTHRRSTARNQCTDADLIADSRYNRAQEAQCRQAEQWRKASAARARAEASETILRRRTDCAIEAVR